jgi:hypothetical protein
MPIPIRDEENEFPVPDPPDHPVGFEATEDLEFPVPDPPDHPVG